jgi:hypothetical protein
MEVDESIGEDGPLDALPGLELLKCAGADVKQ